MNILITSAGRRTSLVKAFQTALKDQNGRVIAADLDSLAPALYVADGAVRLPRVADPEYLSVLTDIISQFNIKILIPTIDTELMPLSLNKEAFSNLGCHVNVSLPSFIEITGDKWLTVTEFRNAGIKTPQSWLPQNILGIPESLFIKPRNGSASQHVYAFNRADYSIYLPRVPDPIIQEYVDGPEYTVDALLDYAGNPIHYVPRLRIRTLGGESIQGVTVDDNRFGKWIYQATAAAGRLGARGAITLQFFDSSQGLVLSEINPRFGGGFPLAYAAGAKYPEWLIEMRQGKTVSPHIGEYQKGLYMTRANTEYFFQAKKWSD